MKYSKVILGPKVTDADYIAPYLKLANPDNRDRKFENPLSLSLEKIKASKKL